MRRTIIVPFVLMCITASGLSYATYAYFSDTETSTANLFQAGHMDLTLNGLNTGAILIAGVNFAPGDSTSGTMLLRNEGSIYTTAANSTNPHSVDLDIRMRTSVADDAGNANDPDDGAVSGAKFARYLNVTTLRYDRLNLLPRIGDRDLDGRSNTLADLGLAPVFTDLADPGAAGRQLTMTVRFANDGQNELKRDVARVDITFFLSQSGDADLE